MTCKKTNLLKRKKLIGTLAAGAAAVYGQAEAEAGIIHLSNNPITSDKYSTYDPVYWDIDGDSSNDAHIWNTTSSVKKFLSSISLNLFRAATNAGALYLLSNSMVSAGNSNLGWDSNVSLLYSGAVRHANNGFSSDQPGYFGFKFNKGSDTHYGWAKTTLTDGGRFGTAVIHEWAYEDTPDTGIQVGDTGASAAVPEPSSAVTALGLLAAGAGGLRRWRREKIVAAA